ncbi:MAG: hypothetical protein ACREPX_13330 [Rhodanobacteraceae bacterium]
MTAAEALAFVERHGIVLEAARHASIPSLVEAAAGEPVRGNWWTHPAGRTIFALTRAVRESPEILVCRIVDGKISFAHARVWPALARLANEFPTERLARLHEVHSESGAHRVDETPFPDWLSPETASAAQRMSQTDAHAALRMILTEPVNEP